MSGKRKNVTLTIQKKLEALFRIDNGESLKKVAADMGVGTSTVSGWKKNRKGIEDFSAKMVSTDGLGNRGTIKNANNTTLDNALYIWYVQECENGVAISGPTLKKKALSLNKKLGGDPTFAASVGWLQRWKGRHGIKLDLSSGSFLGNSISDEKTNHRSLLEDNNEPDSMAVRLTTDDKEDTQSSLHSSCKDLTNLDHAEAVAMLEKLITYFDRQGDTLEAELITLQRLFDRVSEKCSLSIKQGLKQF